jgi:hypothetical protein
VVLHANCSEVLFRSSVEMRAKPSNKFVNDRPIKGSLGWTSISCREKAASTYSGPLQKR